MNKFRYKRIGDDEWQQISSLESLSEILKSSNDKIILRKQCYHVNKITLDGILHCKDCGDDLEVTSYRD